MQRKPLIKGNLSRLRHLLYQFLLVPLVMFIGVGVAEIMRAIWPASESAGIVFVAVFICLGMLMAVIFLVQRLHDAGYSGLWLLAIFFVIILLFVIAISIGNPLVYLVMNFIAMIPTIVICALPSKRENNPWIRRPEPPDEE